MTSFNCEGEWNQIHSPRCLRDIEHEEVLVEVVEVTSVALVEVVGELSFGVVVRGDARVLAHDAKSVAIPDTTQNTGDSLGVAGSRNSLNLAGAGESVIGSTALPERHGLSVDELRVLVMEGTGLEEHIGSCSELREHNNVL